MLRMVFCWVHPNPTPSLALVFLHAGGEVSSSTITCLSRIYIQETDSLGISFLVVAGPICQKILFLDLSRLSAPDAARGCVVRNKHVWWLFVAHFFS